MSDPEGRKSAPQASELEAPCEPVKGAVEADRILDASLETLP